MAAQPDSASLSHIYVEAPTDSLLRPADDQRGDFYRRSLLLRIPFDLPSNRGLLQATLPDTPGGRPGLIGGLVEGMRRGEIQALHPQDARTPYRYIDLVYDLMDIQEIDPVSLEGRIGRDQLDWSGLEYVLEVVAEGGFSQATSREFLRFRCLRLIWHDPAVPWQTKVLAIIPYAQARPWLAQMQAPLPGQTAAPSQPVNRLLETRRFQAIRLRGDALMEEDPVALQPLPPADRQVPDWWEP
ncbi:MAG: hypothetical protein D6722_15570 [Bacteroidetes bacterium]|nr:MAG: hypothetical protein D6722_15570 [Bacteroidota bacterium]